ncbi:MAG: methyltransferase domain-containing protein [Anaerolineaceae bacterium]|nr:methyltransferase domain-containing protein [Anaerolineaceae bacterium]
MNNDPFWDFYWETRLQFLQGQGKGEVIQQASRLMRQSTAPMRILEAGCGEAQIIGSLVEAHGSSTGEHTSIGIDRDLSALAVARKTYPAIRFLEGDFTDTELLQSLGQFDLLLLVNALHHVFSDAYNPDMGEIDVPWGKTNVHSSFSTLAACVSPGGYLILFDGLEAEGSPERQIRIRFQNSEAWQKFQIFAQEYKPFKINFQKESESNTITIRHRDFTRYVTKIIFLGKSLWERERHESYQYFNMHEMQEMLTDNGFVTQEFRLLSVDYDHWLQDVEILTPGVEFPPEHVMITARKTSS